MCWDKIHAKEKQLENLQMSAKEQTGMEVKESIDDLDILKQFPQEPRC